MKFKKLVLSATLFGTLAVGLTSCGGEKQEEVKYDKATLIQREKEQHKDLMEKYEAAVEEKKDLTKEFKPSELVVIAYNKFAQNEMYSIDSYFETSKMDIKETFLRNKDEYYLAYSGRGKHPIAYRIYEKGDTVDYLKTTEFVGADEKGNKDRFVADFSKLDDKENKTIKEVESDELINKKYTTEQFYEEMGVIGPKSVSKYLVSNDTVKEQKIEKGSEGYTITLDFKTDATVLFKDYLDNITKMKHHNPRFTRSKVVYTLDKELNLKKADVDESYKLSVMGGFVNPSVDCKYTIDYNVLSEVSIPIITHKNLKA